MFIPNRVRLKNLPINVKLFFISILPIILIYILFHFYFIPIYEEFYTTEKRDYLQKLLDFKISYYNKIISKLKNPNCDTNAIRNEADNYLSSLSINKKDYFFAFNYKDSTLIVHPLRDTLIGKNVAIIKDADGNQLYLNFLNELKNQQKAFITYNQQIGSNILPKISILYKDTVFNYIIGTGIYTDDIKFNMYTLKRKATSIFILLSLVALLLSYVISRNISKRINNILEFAENINNKNFKLQLYDDREDELGKLSSILNSMVQKLKKSLSIIEQERELALQRNKVKLFLLTSLTENFRTPLLKQLGLLSYEINIIKNNNPVLISTASLINNLFIQIEQISKTLELNELQNFNPKEISLTEIFHKLLSKYSNIVSTRNINLNFEIKKEKLKIYLDETLFNSLLVYITDTLVNYAYNSDISITVDAIKNNTEIRATISLSLLSDMPIESHNLTRLKELYYQTLTSTPENEKIILAMEMLKANDCDINLREEQNSISIEISIPCYFSI